MYSFLLSDLLQFDFAKRPCLICFEAVDPSAQRVKPRKVTILLPDSRLLIAHCMSLLQSSPALHGPRCTFLRSEEYGYNMQVRLLSQVVH